MVSNVTWIVSTIPEGSESCTGALKDWMLGHAKIEIFLMGKQSEEIAVGVCGSWLRVLSRMGC